MIAILDWIGNLIGETTTFILLILLLTLGVASEIWEWIVWLKLRARRPPSQGHSAVEITSLVAGTSSMMLFALYLVGMLRWLAMGKDWALDFWIFGGAGLCWLALAASMFCRGRIRIAGIVVGMLMGLFWWGLWSAVQFARGYAAIFG
jgi:xanthine/uracil permease